MKFLSISFFVALTDILHARVVEYDLHIAAQKWSPPGHREAGAITVNGGVPGPTIRFQVGDTARIRVHNHLKNEDTSIHWHGLLLPNEQDGVPDVTTPPIRPGTTHTFEFPITHSGTYWYHSHTGLQEQQGVFGSIVITPKGGESIHADRDQVVVLSDWTRENANEVTRTLMRGTEWYEFKKGSTQSLLGAAKAGALREYLDRERGRMAAMDISDIAYDAFLANGRESLDLPGKPGETVRLRFINAAAATYFYLESSTGPLKIVAADGPPVQPIQVKRLFTGMAETYDVLVTVPASGRWEIRATAQDGSGHASMWIGEGEEHRAPDVPKADLYRMEEHLLAAMETADGSATDDTQALANEPERPLSPYHRLRALKSTEYPANLPRRTITLRATGDMERYIWSFNGKTFAEDGVIPVKMGEVLRLELINDTMMHHPLHLHGHFFRILMGQGKFSPLKHTIDLPPMSRRTVEFEANEAGDWLFHCHLLYHMHAGMTRIFSYQPDSAEIAGVTGNEPEGDVDHGTLAHQPHGGGHDHDPLYSYIDGSLQSHFSEGRLTIRNSKNDFFADWEVGYVDETDYEIDLGWSRYFNPNFSTDIGWRLVDEEDSENRAFAGINYRLPYLVGSTVQLDSQGDLRVALGKELQITDRLSAFGEIEYDTGSGTEWSVGTNYLLTKQFSLTTQYHSEYKFGGGIRFRF